MKRRAILIRRYNFLFLILLISFCAYGQDSAKLNRLRHTLSTEINDTTRINTLREIGKLYNGIFEDSAVYFTKKALALAEKINWIKGIAQNSLNLGSYFANISNYDSSLFYDNKALAVALILGDKNRIALILSNRSFTYTETEQYVKAMADIKQSLSISEETGNKDRQSRACQAMCELYLYQENNEAAMPWAQRALQLGKELGDEAAQSVAEMCLGGMYSLKNDLSKAEFFLLDATQKAKKTNRPDIIIECCISLSDDYTQTRRYEKAIELIKKNIPLAQEFQLIDPLSALYQNLGYAYFAAKQYKEALTAYQQGYEVIKGKVEFQKHQYGNLEGMAATYAALNNYPEAYQHSIIAQSVKDSALKKQQDKKLLLLQTQFETERKEKQIELLKEDQQLNIESQEKHTTFRYAVYIIICLLILVGFLIVNRFRAVQRTKRLTEINQMRNDIARDLHDDVGSTLTSINILSEVALKQSAEANISTLNIQKIKERSASIMERMNDIVWAINPANDALDKIILRMKEFGAETLEQADIAFIFKEEGELNDIKLSLAQRNNLYLIFKEALNNAVKYSGAKQVIFLLKREPDKLIFKITDNGNGFDAQQQYSGNGLKNMQSRAADMKASFSLQSKPGHGTSVDIILPV